MEDVPEPEEDVDEPPLPAVEDFPEEEAAPEVDVEAVPVFPAASLAGPDPGEEEPDPFPPPDPERESVR